MRLGLLPGAEQRPDSLSDDEPLPVVSPKYLRPSSASRPRTEGMILRGTCVPPRGFAASLPHIAFGERRAAARRRERSRKTPFCRAFARAKAFAEGDARGRLAPEGGEGGRRPSALP